MLGAFTQWYLRPWVGGADGLARVGRIYLLAGLLGATVVPGMMAAYGADGWLWDVTASVLFFAPLGVATLDAVAARLDARRRPRGRRLGVVARLGFAFAGLAAGVFAGYAVLLAFPLGSGAGADVLLSDYRRSMVILTSVLGLLAIVGASLWYRAEAYRQRSAAALATFAVLRHQMQPHFLFNALNSLKELIAADPALAQRATQQLADLYRAIMRASDAATNTLEAELEIVRHYLEIEELRFGARLRFAIDVAAEHLPLHVPSLVLQTLVENAVKHGIGKARAGGEVRVGAARRADGWLQLTVFNTGAPFAPPAARPGPGPSGLSVTRERLAALYGRAGELTVEGGEAAGTRATFAVSGARAEVQ